MQPRGSRLIRRVVASQEMRRAVSAVIGVTGCPVKFSIQPGRAPLSSRSQMRDSVGIVMCTTGRSPCVLGSPSAPATREATATMWARADILR